MTWEDYPDQKGAPLLLMLAGLRNIAHDAGEHYSEARRAERELLLPDYLYILKQIKQTIVDLDFLYAQVEDDATALVPGTRKVTVEDHGDIEIKKSTQTEWDMHGLVSRVAEVVSDEPSVWFDDDGEQLPPHVSARRIMERASIAVKYGYGLVKGLEQLGLDTHEYRTQSYGRRYFALPKPAPSAQWGGR